MKRNHWMGLVLALLVVAAISIPAATAQTGTAPLLGGIRDGSVYLFGAPGTEPVQVFQGGDLTLPTHLKWTPDGQRLLFLATAPEAAGYTLMMADATGGQAQPIADNLLYMPVAFLPDGRVAYLTPGEIGPAQDQSMLPQMSVSVYAQAIEPGATPELIAEIPFGTGCGGGSPFPMDAIYNMEAGFMGNELTLQMTDQGLLHSVSCIGAGLALLNLETGETTGIGAGLARAAMAPDGTRFAALNYLEFPAQAELVTVDLATLAVTPIPTGQTPDQIAWGADGAIYYSVREQLPEPLVVDPVQMQAMVDAGRLGPDSQVPRYRVALYRLDPASGQETLLYETDTAWAIGRIFATTDAAYFSLIFRRVGVVSAGAGRHAQRSPGRGVVSVSSLRVRTVLLDRVSSAISSAFSTWRFSRTVPVAGSTTSTTLRSIAVIASLPASSASTTARPSRAVAVSKSPSLRAWSPSWMATASSACPV